MRADFCSQGARVYTDRWVGIWAVNQYNQSTAFYLGIYFGLGVLYGFITFVRCAAASSLRRPRRMLRVTRAFAKRPDEDRSALALKDSALGCSAPLFRPLFAALWLPLLRFPLAPKRTACSAGASGLRLPARVLS